MYEIVGIVRKVGDFNGIKYDNTHLHCTRLGNEKSGEIGTICEVFKVKTELAHTLAIGDSIEVYYDKFGKISRIETL